MTPAEHADEASALAEWGSRLLRDFTDDNDRDRAVMVAHCMFAGSEAHSRAAAVQRARIAEERRADLVASFARPRKDTT